jgi:hypothetical protein
MAKQIYTGPPVGVAPANTLVNLTGWVYRETDVPGLPMREPLYSLWRKDISGEFGVSHPHKAAVLWWNGARWVVWITNLFIGESTEFKDINDPPMEWAESMYTLVNE